jgi:hypothetical protein
MKTTFALTVSLIALASLNSWADETEVLFDGAAVADWDPMRDQQRLQREFAVSKLSAVKSPSALAWRFVSRGVAFNDLFLKKPVERPFRQVRVLVRNEGEPFRFAAKMQDASGAEWTVPAVALPRGDWRWIDFPREQWHVASWSRDADGKLDFPLAYFTLIAFDVKPGPEYRLQVQRVEVVRPDPPVATVHVLDMPDRLSAGQTVQFSLSFTLDKACTEDGASLVFRRDRTSLAEVPLPLLAPPSKLAPGQRVDLKRVPLIVPQYAFGGKAAVSLKLGEARARFEQSTAPPDPSRPEQRPSATADQPLRTVTIEQRPTGRTVAEVKPQRGVPTLLVNGRPHSGMSWATYTPTVEVFGDFARAGIDLFTFSGTPSEAGYGLSKTVWTAPGQFDYSEFDRRVLMVLQANPRAYFFPRLYLHAPAWWSAQHPDDIVLKDPGDGRPVPFVHAGGKPAPSWASEAWRRDTVEALRRLVEHIAASPYADRVIGYHLASGTTEEWMMWGGNENEWVDYSPVNARAFRRWLQTKYGTDERLKSAWADPAATLATAAVPAKTQRAASHLGWLRDPAREQAAIDYYLYNADLVAETIGYFAKAVKDLTQREKIVGVFYGYLLQLCGEQRQQNVGHLALGRVLASPDVDFLCSPTSYAFRQLGGEGTCHAMSLLGSVQLHGKLWFDENDVRTSLSGGKVGDWGRPADLAGDVLQQDKELAWCLVHGTAQWWFDVGGNRYNHPVLMGRIKELAAHAGEALQCDRTAADEIAYVVDERSLCYLRVGDPIGNWLLLGQLPALHRLGAPVGHYLVTDLAQLASRKLFFLPTNFAPTDADRRAIDALKRDGHVLVFLGAPGIYRDGRVDEQGMFDLTGIRLKLSREPAAPRVTLQLGQSRPKASAAQKYGPERRTWPICYADDPSVGVWGKLADGRAGLVVKEHGTWTAVYSAAPLLPASLLRCLSRLAGVHQYLETEDVVWASRDLVAISVQQPGPRTIHLPRAADVSDLYAGSVVARGARSFSAEFKDRSTRVFVLR